LSKILDTEKKQILKSRGVRPRNSRKENYRFPKARFWGVQKLPK